jgi:hypothetical protein
LRSNCIGLLFDGASNLGHFNQLVSGSGSVPNALSTYNVITRLTAMNGIICPPDPMELVEIREFTAFPVFENPFSQLFPLIEFHAIEKRIYVVELCPFNA